MKISAITAFVVRAPRRRFFGRAYESALGPARYAEHVVVRVETNEGIDGIGEVASVFSCTVKRSITSSLRR
jgi:L-alanine-DL-glutamate epimerase-like enolase superfamily enzyme